jgi:3-phenylpropionate/cinnamic acid dioxygenase small subunit
MLALDLESIYQGDHMTISFKPARILLICAAVAAAAGCSNNKELEARLQRTEDLMAIEHLMVGIYPKALDTRDWKTYASLFTEDGELIQGTNVIKGPAAIEERFSNPPPRQRPAAADAAPAAGQAAAAAPATGGAAPSGEQAAAPRPRPITKHVVTNLDIKLDGDRATATGYWQTISTRQNGTVVAGAGHYVDELVKVNGEWKFKKREIVNPSRPAAAGDAPAATPPEAAAPQS